MERALKDPLRVLLANERAEHLEQMALLVTRLGHAVIARETNIEAVAALTEEGTFDVAIVGVGEDTAHALDLIGRIVREANCPVIAVLDVEDPAFIHQAAKRGVFAYLTTKGAYEEQLESAIDEDLAFLMLRDQSRKSNRKLIDIAQSVLEAQALLPNTTPDARD